MEEIPRTPDCKPSGLSSLPCLLPTPPPLAPRPRGRAIPTAQPAELGAPAGLVPVDVPRQCPAALRPHTPVPGQAQLPGNAPGFPLPCLEGQTRPALSWPCLSCLVVTAQPLGGAVRWLPLLPALLLALDRLSSGFCPLAPLSWLPEPGPRPDTCGRASVLGLSPWAPAFPLPAPDPPGCPRPQQPPPRRTHPSRVAQALPHPDWTSGHPCVHPEPASRSAQPADSNSFRPCQPPTHPTRRRTPWPGHVWLVLARLLRVFLARRPAAGALRLLSALFTDASAVLRSSARVGAPSEGPVSAYRGRRGRKSEPSFCPALFKLLVPQEASEAPRTRPWLL